MRGLLILSFAIGLAVAEIRGPLDVRSIPQRTRTAEFETVDSCPESPTLSRTKAASTRDCADSAKEPAQIDDSNFTLLDHATLAAVKFINNLPNFICDQLTDRYEGTVRGAPKWKLRDRVSAEVLMVEGKESYRNLRRNGKSMREDEMWRSGTWSTGEFGTVLRNLFAQATETEFKFRKETTLHQVPTHLYDYSVTQPKSRWRVEFEGLGIFPAFTGSVWIDPLSKRVLRVEMMAREIPPDFPMDLTEMTVDYGPVLIAGESHLMPIRSENLACQRGTSRCVRNTIEFRNYRKFTAESTFTTVDSSITFEGGPESKK